MRQPTFLEILSKTPSLLMVGVVQLGMHLGYSKQIMQIMAKQMHNDSKAFVGYKATEHDVFAAVFSKSGTNWMMQITQQITHYGDAEFDHIHAVVAWPKRPMLGIMPLNDPTPQSSSPTGLRVIKTHLTSRHVPYNEKATYITVIRDPKEVCVSAYHFFATGVFGVDRLSFEDWYDLFLQPDSFGAQWADHTASFWAWRDFPNVLVLTYNEMKQDPQGSIQRIADTMGVALTPAQFDKVVERSSFQYMKKQESRFMPPPMPFSNLKLRPTMIRRGQSGESDELLTQQQQAAIDQFAQAELQRLGSDFPYAELFEVVENPATIMAEVTTV